MGDRWILIRSSRFEGDTFVNTHFATCPRSSHPLSPSSLPDFRCSLWFNPFSQVAMAATSIQRQRQHTKKSDDPRDRTQKRDGVREDHVNKLSSTAGAHAATHNSRKSGTDGSIGTRAAMEESSSTNLSSSGGVGGTSLTSESAAPTGSDSNGFESRSNEDGGLAPRQCHGTWHEPPVVQVFTAGEASG